jgi:hypothetical protein
MQNISIEDIYIHTYIHTYIFFKNVVQDFLAGGFCVGIALERRDSANAGQKQPYLCYKDGLTLFSFIGTLL